MPSPAQLPTDAGAYFAGVFLGRHRGVTQVSPNKSVEGYIGGFVSGVAFALLYGLVAGEIARVPVDLLSLALSVMAATSWPQTAATSRACRPMEPLEPKMERVRLIPSPQTPAGTGR